MEIMNHLWSLEAGGGTVRDVLACYDEPLPAYSTTATFLKILVQKGFLMAEKRDGDGKTFFFRPLVSRDEYRKQTIPIQTDSSKNGNSREIPRLRL